MTGTIPGTTITIPDGWEWRDGKLVPSASRATLMLRWIAARLAEPSTRLGIGALIAGTSHAMAGDYVGGITMIAGALAGILTPERGSINDAQVRAAIATLPDGRIDDLLLRQSAVPADPGKP